MRSQYPTDAVKLPTVDLSKYGMFDAYYDVGSGTVSGWLRYETTQKEKRKYVFSVSWKNGVPDAKISVANPELGLDFDMRETRDGEPVYRELKGLPKTSRKDLHQYACRIGKEIRSIYIDDYDFLTRRVADGAFEIGRAFVGPVEEVLYKDEDWLIIARHTVRGIFLRAEKIADPLRFSSSVEDLMSRSGTYEERRRKLGLIDEDNDDEA